MAAASFQLFVPLLVASGTLVGCERRDVPPLGPDADDGGIVVFVTPGYGGYSHRFVSDVDDLTKVSGPCRTCGRGGCTDCDLNDSISSVQVTPGWTATFYVDRDFGGDALEVATDVYSLWTIHRDDEDWRWTGCISSIRVRRR
jgi:hypothetical protein